jgi:hypothetical protein
LFEWRDQGQSSQRLATRCRPVRHGAAMLDLGRDSRVANA